MARRARVFVGKQFEEKFNCTIRSIDIDLLLGPKEDRKRRGEKEVGARTVFVHHNIFSDEDAVGKWKDIKVVGKDIYATPEFFDDYNSQKIEDKWESEVLNACSAGVDYELELDDMGNKNVDIKIKEFSIVGVPALKGAIGLSEKHGSTMFFTQDTKKDEKKHEKHLLSEKKNKLAVETKPQNQIDLMSDDPKKEGETPKASLQDEPSKTEDTSTDIKLSLEETQKQLAELQAKQEEFLTAQKEAEEAKLAADKEANQKKYEELFLKAREAKFPNIPLEGEITKEFQLACEGSFEFMQTSVDQHIKNQSRHPVLPSVENGGNNPEAVALMENINKNQGSGGGGSADIDSLLGAVNEKVVQGGHYRLSDIPDELFADAAEALKLQNEPVKKLIDQSIKLSNSGKGWIYKPRADAFFGITADAMKLSSHLSLA
ncbi:MAG: hypothetical protein OXB93_01835, partial [Cytophagales bacterium]|nr:hypothetical protein [Cytophagales bacterium]